MEFDRSQMNKGLLEGCILKIIMGRSTYGYDIVLRLNERGFHDVKEGTIYPLLVRLEKKGIIESYHQPSPLGPKRKYYRITAAGEGYLDEFIQAWRGISASVDTILGGEANAAE